MTEAKEIEKNVEIEETKVDDNVEKSQIDEIIKNDDDEIVEVEETIQPEKPKFDKMEQIAIKGGFVGDNYYTAKDKMLSRCMRSEESSFAYPFEFTRVR
jgi:hypothetical protein|tara:strand:+ start:597 stop:893 length:297 start_codon:yes stop_codon:yes gene_type:complete